MPDFSVEKLPNEPIVIITEYPSYDPITHMDAVVDQIIAAVERFERPGLAVHVSRNGYSLDEIAQTAQDMLVKGARLRQQPRYRGMIFVVIDRVLKIALTNMANEVLGGLTYPVFDNLDEAVAYARANV